MECPAHIQRKVKAICPELSIQWVPRAGRFAVFHDLQIDDRYEASVDTTARGIMLEAGRQGLALNFHDVAEAAREAVHAGRIVCYIVEDNGDFRPPDDRIVTKLQRMNFWRMNFGIRDWQEMLQGKTDAMRASLERSRNAVWESIRRDPVFARQVSDILWGQRPIRSIVVPGRYEHETAFSDSGADGCAASGEAPGGDGTQGDASPVPVADA